MNNKKKWIVSLLPIILLLVVFSGCSKNPQKAYITQVLDHPESMQNGAVYTLQDKKLTVFKRYILLSNPNSQPTETATEEIKAQIEQENKRLKTEFSETLLNQEDFEQPIEKVVNNAKIKIDNKKRTVRLIGKNYQKEFKMVEDNNFRIVDDAGIEYELKLQ